MAGPAREPAGAPREPAGHLEYQHGQYLHHAWYRIRLFQTQLKFCLLMQLHVSESNVESILTNSHFGADYIIYDSS